MVNVTTSLIYLLFATLSSLAAICVNNKVNIAPNRREPQGVSQVPVWFQQVTNSVTGAVRKTRQQGKMPHSYPGY